MADKAQKGKSIVSRGPDDEEEISKASTHEHDEEHEHEEDEDEASEGDEDAEDAEQRHETEDEDAEAEEAGAVAGEGGEAAARAQRVASSLGVGAEEEGGEIAEDEAPAAPANRAARRAEAAQRRKKRKGASDATALARTTDEDVDVGPLPKDKNARAKELLKRRREQASEARPIQLLPGEMVDDALARSSSAVSKWIRDNFGIIQWVIIGGVVAGAGYLFYQSRADNTSAQESAELMAGVNDDRGRVMAEDKRSDDEKAADPGKVFKTDDERTDTALAAYKKVSTEHPGTGPATLARLGEGGDYLDKHDWDQALAAYSAVSSSTLAGADPDVKGRALEGIGFAKEGKGDLDGALASFKELEGIDARGYKELGLYHEGRVWLAKGDTDKAKDFLKQAHDKLEQPTTEGQQAFRYLQQMTAETLRRIDPSLVPSKPPAIGGPKGGAMTGDELEKLKRKLEEAMKQHGGDHH